MKKGFTLAETLITLSIIGVIAAVTMPMLITSYKKMTLKNQFKKVYSVLNTAYQKTVFDMGGDTGCFYNYPENEENHDVIIKDGCDIFYEEFVKNLSVAKICPDNALANGCIKDYKFGTPPTGCNHFSNEKINNNATAYVLNDGAILIPFGNKYPLMMVDINGQKSPNITGQDVFSLSFHNLAFKNVKRIGPSITNNPNNPNGLLGCVYVDDKKVYFDSLDDIIP